MSITLCSTSACTVLILAIVATPLFRAADTPPTPEPRRIRTLDGLRGLLALAVVFHHAVSYRALLGTGLWQAPADQFSRDLGPLGVAMFFMITGFLFYGKIAAQAGRPNWLALYVNRVFRLAPVYLLAASLMLIADAVFTHGTLLVPATHHLSEVARWLAFGIFNVPNFVSSSPEGVALLVGVTWTVHMEWLFYFSLPLQSIFTRVRRTADAFPFVLLAICCVRMSYRPPLGWQPNTAMMLSDFAMGMIASVALHWRSPLIRDVRLSSALSLLLLGSFFAFPHPYGPAQALIIGSSFYLIASGADFFGLLTSRSAIRLGDVSYGVYLLQGLALSSILRPFHSFATGSQPAFWLLTFVSTLLLVVASTATHVLLERPSIALGRRLLRHHQAPAGSGQLPQYSQHTLPAKAA